MTQKFTDAASIGGGAFIRDSDGFLVAEAFAVRSGIQIYTGAEVGLSDRKTVRVWRPEDEVRDPESLLSFSHATVTLGHPTEMVDKSNWEGLAKGEVSTEATWDGNKIKLPLIIKAQDAIAAIEGGTRELSAGYTCSLDFIGGITPEGEQYDAVQRDIRANHLAIVPLGRAGSECRIGDGAVTWGASPLTDAAKEKSMTLRKIMVDGLEVETTDAGAAAIKKLEGQLADQKTANSQAQDTHEKDLVAKDEEIGTLKADKKSLEDAAMTPERVSKLVADRVALETVVKAVDASIKLEGVSDADIRKAAVAKKLGDEMVKDASDAEVSGMFKAVAKDASANPVDPLVSALKNGVKPTLDASTAEAAAYAKYLADFNTIEGEAN